MKKKFLLLLAIPCLLCLICISGIVAARYMATVPVTNGINLSISVSSSPETPEEYATATLIFISCDENGNQYEYDRKTVQSNGSVVMPEAPAYYTENGYTLRGWSSGGSSLRSTYSAGITYKGSNFCTVASGDKEIKLYDVYDDFYVVVKGYNNAYYQYIAGYMSVDDPNGNELDGQNIRYDNVLDTAVHTVYVHPAFSFYARSSSVTMSGTTYEGQVTVVRDGSTTVASAQAYSYSINPFGFHYYEVELRLVKPSCFAAGTLITLADGTQKPIEELQQDDLVLAFDHETGALTAVPLLYYCDDGVDHYRVMNLEFSDGRTTRIIYEHGLFDLTLNRYVYIREDTLASYIGHEFAVSDGAGGHTAATLTNAYVTQEQTGCYSITSLYHLNYYIDGLLSIPGAIEGLFNYFEYGENLVYDQEKMQADIETYGLYTYENFADYATLEMFETIVPAAYLKVSVGKGLVTFEELLTMFQTFIVTE